MICPCKELEVLRAYKERTEKLIREQDRDLIILSRRCAARAEILKVQVKRTARQTVPRLGLLGEMK